MKKINILIKYRILFLNFLKEQNILKKAKYNILKKYDDKNKFITKLNKMISCSINEYFGIDYTIDNEIDSE